jgi:hypothetical protein
MMVRHTASVLALLALAACSGDTKEPVVTPKANPAVQRELDAAKDPTSKMARAVSGKPGAAVDVKYDIATKPEAGVATEVKLAIIPRTSAERMTYKIAGMEGLTVAGTLEVSVDKPEAGKVYEHAFSLLPDRTGIFYASVTVMLESAGSQMGRTFSVPLLVGETQASEKPTVPPATDATGQPIESMRAEER